MAAGVGQAIAARHCVTTAGPQVSLGLHDVAYCRVLWKQKSQAQEPADHAAPSFISTFLEGLSLSIAAHIEISIMPGSATSGTASSIREPALPMHVVETVQPITRDAPENTSLPPKHPVMLCPKGPGRAHLCNSVGKVTRGIQCIQQGQRPGDIVGQLPSEEVVCHGVRPPASPRNPQHNESLPNDMVKVAKKILLRSSCRHRPASSANTVGRHKLAAMFSSFQMLLPHA